MWPRMLFALIPLCFRTCPCSKVWGEHFRELLGIREKSHHATCTVCLKHKLILRKLQSDRLAHEAQTKLYGAHIRHQYEDRVLYWSTRSQSRLGTLQHGYRVICCILDGMDKSKFRCPRSINVQAKEFASFVRPAVDVHGVLTHGHMAALYLSDANIPKDSSWCTDILCNALDELGRSVDLRTVRFVAQSDNTTREVKNNTILRAMGYFVATRRLHSAELRTLRVGHSHEDIDGWFSQLNSVLESTNELRTPEAFRVRLDQYLQLSTTRPYTRIRTSSPSW